MKGKIKNLLYTGLIAVLLAAALQPAHARIDNPSSGGGGTPAGSSGDFQYNNAGSFGGFTPGAGIQTFLTTPSSANFATALTDENGSGKVCFSAGTLAVASGKTLTASNTLTFTGTDSSSVAFGAGGTVLYSGGALGTPSSGTATNLTGLPLTTGVTGILPAANGGQDHRITYVAVTSTYSVLAADHIVNATSGTFTATLPTAASVSGKEYIIKNSGIGVVTVATTSSQTIDGQLTRTLNQWEAITVVSDGANWMIIG